MPLDESEVQRRVVLMKDALRSRGMRLTHQRLEVVREIAAAENHPDVETVFRSVRTRVPTISLDTVYRTLATLVEVGCVTRLAVNPGAARHDANLDHHHHFVCVQCGDTHDVAATGIDVILPAGTTEVPGRIETTEVWLRGVCKGCQHDEQQGDSHR